MKKTFLSLVIAATMTMPGCDRQKAERMDHVLLELKAAQAESKRMADQMASLTAGQEELRKSLAAARNSLDEARVQAANDLAAAQTKASEQQKKVEEELGEAKKLIAGLKAAAEKSVSPPAAQPQTAKTNPTTATTGDTPSPVPAQSSGSKTGDGADGRKSYKIDFGDGTQSAKPPKSDKEEAAAPPPSPPRDSLTSSGVRSGNYKFIEKSPPKTGAASFPPGAVSSGQGKSFISPVGGIYFRFNSARGEWTSGKGAVRAGGDAAGFVSDLERRLKSDGKIPKGASLFLQDGGSIIIEPSTGGGVNPQRVPDPKELSPQRVPDPKELGKTAVPTNPDAVGGGSQPPPTKVQ